MRWLMTNGEILKSVTNLLIMFFTSSRYIGVEEERRCVGFVLDLVGKSRSVPSYNNIFEA